MTSSFNGFLSLGYSYSCIFSGRTSFFARLPIATIASFWIDEYESGMAKLILKSTKKAMVYIIVPLVPEVRADEVRHFFFQHNVAEVEHHEPISQQIMEYLGF